MPLHEFLVDCLVHVSHVEMKYLMRWCRRKFRRVGRQTQLKNHWWKLFNKDWWRGENSLVIDKSNWVKR
jgi:hypothetical protein